MKINEDQLSIATRIAQKAHAGQFRRDGVTPYFEHPWRVQKRLEGESIEIRCAALMHDVLEDSTFCVCDLQNRGVSNDVIEAVRVLTKQDEHYEVYLTAVKMNPIALKVKIADMLANLGDSPTEKQILKYAKGLTFLLTP